MFDTVKGVCDTTHDSRDGEVKVTMGESFLGSEGLICKWYKEWLSMTAERVVSVPTPSADDLSFEKYCDLQVELIKSKHLSDIDKRLAESNKYLRGFKR